MRVVLLCLALLASAPSILAQLCERDVFVDVGLGDDISLERRFLAIGAPTANSIVTYELVNGGWEFERKIGGAIPGEFGYSVDIDVSTLVVGAPAENGQIGAVYSYRRLGGQWVPTQRLESADGTLNRFGSCVAVSGNTLVAGAAFDDDAALVAGAAYVFKRSTATSPWIETQKLLPSDLAAFDVFGFDIALERNVLVIGAPQGDTFGINGGAVYVFERLSETGAFFERARLFDPSPRPADIFGAAVALDVGNPVDASDDVVLIGAPYDDEIEVDAGMVSVVRRVGPTWGIKQQFAPSDAATLDRFGSAIDIEDGRAVVSAPSKNAGLGEVLIFEEGPLGFAETQRVSASMGPSSPGFGRSVDLSGGTVVVGAHTLLAPTGVVYVYAGLNPWIDLGNALAGTMKSPNLSISSTLCPDTLFELDVDDALPSALAALVLGLFPINAPFKGGTLAPNPNFIFGLATTPLGTIELTTPWPSDIPPGFDLVIQVWIEDPGAVQGFSATNALAALTP